MFEFETEDTAPTRKDVVGPAMLALLTAPEEYEVAPDFQDEQTLPRKICLQHGRLLSVSGVNPVREPIIGGCAQCEVSK
jgi:hypothetical protein